MFFFFEGCSANLTVLIRCAPRCTIYSPTLLQGQQKNIGNNKKQPLTSQKGAALFRATERLLWPVFVVLPVKWPRCSVVKKCQSPPACQNPLQGVSNIECDCRVHELSTAVTVLIIFYASLACLHFGCELGREWCWGGEGGGDQELKMHFERQSF